MYSIIKNIEIIFVLLLFALPTVFILVLLSFPDRRYTLNSVYICILLGFFFLFYLCFSFCHGLISVYGFLFKQWVFLSFYFLFFIMFTFFVIFDDLLDSESATLLSLLLFFSLNLISSRDFISFFVLVEAITLCVFILIVHSREGTTSLESAVKYLVINLISSAIFLLGICGLYIQYGSFTFLDLVLLRKFLPVTELVPLSFDYLGLFCIIISFLIKFSVFPFHRWLLDVYSGLHGKALWVVTIFSKPVMFFAFGNIIPMINEFPYAFFHIFLIVGVSSMFFGSVILLFEFRSRAFIGLLSLVSSGTAFLILGVPVLSMSLLLVYLLCQSLILCLFLNFLAFPSLSLDVNPDITFPFCFYDYSPSYALIYFLIVLSLIGVPPFIVFSAKLMLVFFLIKKGFYFIVFFILFTTLLNAIALLRICVYFLKFDRKRSIKTLVITSEFYNKYYYSIAVFLLLSLFSSFFILFFCFTDPTGIYILYRGL